MKFLEPRSDFSNIELRPHPKDISWAKKSGEFVVCPSCHGHGKWNLELNAYGPGKHFQGGCTNCTGWGWVEARSPNALCVHEWEEIPTGVMHDHHSKCKRCGHEIRYDSSG